jgi:hypothetical protein
MIRIVVLILVLAYPQSSKQDAPDLKIVGISWRGTNQYVDSEKGAFSIDVKNTGTKVVVAVEWEYVLIDRVRRIVYDRLHFVTDDKNLSPGEKKRLTKRIDYSWVPKYVEAVPRINRVTYSDGTAWSRQSLSSD